MIRAIQSFVFFLLFSFPCVGTEASGTRDRIEMLAYIQSPANKALATEMYMRLRENFAKNWAYCMMLAENKFGRKIYAMDQNTSGETGWHILSEGDFTPAALHPTFVEDVRDTKPAEVTAAYEDFYVKLRGFIEKAQRFKSHTEPRLLNSLVRNIIECGEPSSIIKAVYIHTALSPCDTCHDTIQHFANAIRVPVFVTYNTGYYSVLAQYRTFHARTHSKIIEEGEGHPVIFSNDAINTLGGTEQTRNTYVLLYNPQ